jgi:hypothetical protein
MSMMSLLTLMMGLLINIINQKRNHGFFNEKINQNGHILHILHIFQPD